MNVFWKKLSATLVLVTLAAMFLQVRIVVADGQTAADMAFAFIEDVAGIDVAKYDVNITGHNVYPNRPTYGDNPVEMVKYTMTSEESELHVIADFVKGKFNSCNFYFDKGEPIYTQLHASVLDEAKRTFRRYQLFSGNSLPEEIGRVMYWLTPSTANTNTTSNNLKLISSLDGNSLSIRCFYSENGIDYTRKGMGMTFENGNLITFGEEWNLFTVGNAPSISKEEAIETAIEAAKNSTLRITIGPDIVEEVSFTVDPEHVDVELHPVVRETLTLQPMWSTRVYLEKVVHYIYCFLVQQWADTGEIRYVTSISGMYREGPVPSESTPQATESPSPATGTTETTDQPYTMLLLAAGLTLIMIPAAVFVVLKKRRNK